MGREYFKAFHSYLKSIEPLNDSERGRLFTAMLEYSITGEAPVLKGNERFIFPTMKENLDREIKSYRDSVERNRANGSLGGRPPKTQKTDRVFKNRSVFSKTQEKEKEEDKDKEKDKEKYKDKEKEKIIPPKSPQGDLQGELSKSSLSDDVKSALSEWLDYKRERKEKYTLTGWKKLLTITARQIESHRESDVIALIEESMANGWQGIIWDRLGRKSTQNPPEKPPESRWDYL